MSEACRLFAAIGLALALTLAGASRRAAAAQDKPKIKVGSLTLPVFAPIVVNIMKAKGFDAKNGFELDVVSLSVVRGLLCGPRDRRSRYR